jgi:hypothetical protein
MNEIFGTPNAESDPLLEECFVGSQEDFGRKPILTGRWGTGKTATLFHRNIRLRHKLKEYGCKRKQWYINESSFDIEQILALRKHYGDEKYVLELSLKKLWRAEITRAILAQLSVLWEYYGKPEGAHWVFSRGFSKTEKYVRPLWGNLADILHIISGSTSGQSSIDNTKPSIEALFNNVAYEYMQECLEDIQGHDLQPAVAIEPIETPDSPLEKQAGIAQITINALLDTYQSSFEITDEQRANVMISIPWHRYRSDQLVFPHKMRDYIRSVTWEESSLREFINERIEWQFNKANRAYSTKVVDAWDILFGKSIKNEYCYNSYIENSFQYILRHSHYRARDIQRIARKIIEEACRVNKITPHELFRGKSIREIPFEIIRETIRKESRELYKDRLVEGKRRYPELADILNLVDGIAVPFDSNELKRHLSGGSIDIDRAKTILWKTGFLGIEITPRNEQVARNLMGQMGKCAFRRYDIAGSYKVMRWYFFEHITGRTHTHLIGKYSKESNLELKYVLHPITADAMSTKVSQKCPIGA